ncbi:MAG: ion channel, partial [bacterium]
ILLGIAWAFMYAFIDIIHPNSFAVHFASQPLERIDGDSIYDYFYYSFVVLCTVGFGDVTPFSPLAKSFSILEAITAQIYLTVIIARLVGMHISKR